MPRASGWGSLLVRDVPGGLAPRSFATSDWIPRIGHRAQLALEQGNEILVVLERFCLASRGGQGLDDQPMRILSQGIHRDGPIGDFERGLRVPRLQFLLAVADQGVERDAFQSLAFRAEPIRPCVFRDIKSVSSGPA